MAAILVGALAGCSNSTSTLERAPLDVAKEKTTKFANSLLAGKDTSASQFTKDVSYDASHTPILVDGKGNITEGGILKYFDEDNHAVKLEATDKNELTASIDFNDDGLFSDDEIFIIIDPDEFTTGSGNTDVRGPIDMPDMVYVPLSDWLDSHSAMDTVDVYIALPVKSIAPVYGGDAVSTMMIEIDTEATKKQILDFINENGLTRNDSIDEALESGMNSLFQINLTKEKIESLLAKYDENTLWIDLVEGISVID